MAKCLLVLLIVIAPSLSYGNDYYESQLDKGIRNLDAYAYLLIAKADRSDRETALQLLHEALAYAPDLPAVYFALSKATFSFSFPGVLDSVDYIVRGIDAYGRNFWWSFTIAGSLFFSFVFSFVLAFFLIVAVRLFPDVPLFSHDVGETSWKSLLLLAVLALSAASPLLFLGSMAVLIGFYMKRSSRIIVYVFLLFLLLFPLLSKTALQYLNGVTSGSLKAIVNVNESVGNGYAIATLQSREDFVSMFSYALALKREGRYGEAIDVYERLLQNGDPRVYVNLGNCYVGRYLFDETRSDNLEEDESTSDNLEEAVKYYSASLRIKPNAAAYYNLSQVSREMLDFAKGEEYFRAALAVDRASVARYRAISGRTPNRFVMDQTLAPSEMWDYVMKLPDRISSLGVSAVPPPVVSLGALLLGIIFYGMNSRVRRRAYRCRKCSKILCEKCEKRVVWGQMCPECYASLIKLEEMDVRERVARLLSIYDQQRRHRGFLKVLSFVMPGLPEAYAGRILVAFCFLWPFLFFLLLPCMIRLVVPNSHQVSHSVISWASFCLAGLLYLLFHLITRKRIAKGWL